MKVQQMISERSGRPVANQFVITDTKAAPQIKTFRSYDSIIATIEIFDYDTKRLFLDEKYWDYSRTTSKYRNQFTGLTTAETEAGINNGTINLVNLNE